ncbi:Protein of unknown function DUF4817,Domain of unknown function DUF4371 [Cinara cedri]|uniref:DUF4817 domain-containing protein n=1 Tax=Cinara cedri TaxID=506608 RepID=A0A5E4N5E0_9HEMI|nr:Protein of unknown function DUF4817,Domain of unknown function DUF4371 [Cinara cedri]
MRADNFIAVYSKNCQNIIQKLDSARAIQIEENRKKKIPIIQTIVFCGSQEIALRGTNGYGPFSLDNSEPIYNEGNFLTLLRMRVSCEDKNLTYRIENQALNTTYISSMIQNNFINVRKKIIQGQLVYKINQAKCLSALVDETTDASRVEQLSLCVRYLDNNLNIEKNEINNYVLKEDFLQFVPVSSTGGQNLATVILGTLKNLGITCDLQGAATGRLPPHANHLHITFTYCITSFCVQRFNKCESAITVQRDFRRTYGTEAPTAQSIRRWHQTFQESLCAQKRSGRPRTSDENIERVRQSFVRTPQKSTRRAGLELDLPHSTVWRVLRRRLTLKAYRLQLLRVLLPEDKQKRIDFCDFISEKRGENESFVSRIVFSDEATFHVSGKVNRHNVRIWALEQSHATVEHQRDSPKINVFCAISREKVYGPFCLPVGVILTFVTKLNKT